MSTWEKAFDTFQWENRSQSTNTPLDATHLNKVNDALDVIDDRVIELQSADADIEEEIAGKQDALTFDDVPTDGSNNPVKSNGIYDALDGKVDKNGTDRLMTAAEGAKLAGIAAGAQVNVLEGVQVNGSDLPISGKKVNVDISGKTDLSVIAYTFNSEMGYFKGAYVTYNGKLYEFIQEHTGAWNPSHVREIRASGQYVRTGNGGYNNGDRATCEGYMTKASGNYSHAEGRETQAVGECTHAEGRETIANSIYQHVEGKYNIADNESKYIHIIGNGIDDNNRSNAMTLDWDGNLEVSGEVEDGNGKKISDKADKVTNATSGHLAGLDSNGNLTDSGVSPTEDVTVEGNPVTFDSPFEQDAKSVVVSVKPIQAGSGTPSPENIRPISGIDEVEIPVTGKNLFDVGNDLSEWLTTENNGTKITSNPISSRVTANLDRSTGSIVVTNYDTIGWWWMSKEVKLSKNTNYRFVNLRIAKKILGFNSLDNGSTGTVIAESDSDSIFNSGDYKYWVLSIFPMNVNTNNVMVINDGVADTEFEPYNPNSHTTTIPLPSTLYGGTVDVTNGIDTPNYGMAIFDGSEDEGWGYSPTWGKANTNVFYLPADATIKFLSWDDYFIKKCNCLTPMTRNEIYDADTTGIGMSGSLSGGNITIRVPKVVSDVSELRTWLSTNNVQAVYELATPTTLSLTPTDVELLEGTNVVTTNGEKVAVTYGRSLWQDINDLKTDTEGKLNKSDVADVEGDTASKAYSVNDFMLRSDGLYKVTQPIAQNASITASNTTKTTVGEVLTALLNA